MCIFLPFGTFKLVPMAVGFVHALLAYQSFVECKVSGYEDTDWDVQHQCVINILLFCSVQGGVETYFNCINLFYLVDCKRPITH